MTLPSHFIQQPKCENGIKTGTRRKGDGSTIQVRAGKIMSRFYPDGSRDKYGAEMKMKALKQQADNAIAAKRQQAHEAVMMKMRHTPRAP
jgi:hypothetical protein